MAHQNTNWETLFADIFRGTLGGISLTLVGHPFDTVKTQPTAQPIYNGMLDCAAKTIKWEGLGGLYKGVLSPLVGQMFFRAVLFSAYGQSTAFLSRSRPQLDVKHHYLAGGITGMFAATVEGPVDLFKSQMQVQIIKAKTIPNYVSPYSSVFHVARESVRINGFRGPYQGFLATVARNIPGNAMYFGTFELLRRQYMKIHDLHDLSQVPPHVSFWCGGIGGLCYWLAVYPTDVVKSAIMTDNIDPKLRRFKGYGDAIRFLWADRGIRSFFKGFSVCLLRAIPANGAIFLTVMELKKRGIPY